MKVLAVVLMLAFSLTGYAKEPSAKTGAVIKKSKSGICHSPSSSHYVRTHSFTSFWRVQQVMLMALQTAISSQS
jgi:hypothetical protein